jgi:CheY-like chemotaxis protein
LIDSAGRLLDWDSGLQLEFAAVADRLVRGGDWRDIAARARDHEGFERTGPATRQGRVRCEYGYRAGEQLIEVTESPLLGGHWNRAALAVNVERASIAHDLSNIFTAALSNAESILQENAPDAPIGRQAQAIQRAVARGVEVLARLKLLDASRAPRQGESAELPVPAPAKQFTILLVDDHDLIRAAVANNLRALNYRVLVADGATAAMRWLRSDEHIDLLFTDVIMPGGMGGAELAREAQALRPDLKRLFASGFGAVSLEQSDQLAPGAQLLLKPYDLPQLLEMLQRMLVS